MKTVSCVVTALFLLFSLAGYSQKEQSSVKFGLKAGVNIANISIKTKSSSNFIPNTTSSIGGTAGVFATLPVSSQLSIQPELLYSMLGYKLTDRTGGATLHANYLVLPVLAKYNFQSSGFAVYAGPQIGLLLSAKAKSDGRTFDAKDEYKKTDLSGIIGAEYTFPVGFNISGRYQLGLSNIGKDAPPGESVKNNSITFTVGFSF
jgi:hypothetical protein